MFNPFSYTSTCTEIGYPQTQLRSHVRGWMDVGDIKCCFRTCYKCSWSSRSASVCVCVCDGVCVIPACVCVHGVVLVGSGDGVGAGLIRRVGVGG